MGHIAHRRGPLIISCLLSYLAAPTSITTGVWNWQSWYCPELPLKKDCPELPFRLLTARGTRRRSHCGHFLKIGIGKWSKLSLLKVAMGALTRYDPVIVPFPLISQLQ